MLTDHLDELNRLAAALLEFETLSGDESKRVIAGEDIDRSENSGSRATVASSGGSSIPKTRRPGSWGDPAPQGA